MVFNKRFKLGLVLVIGGILAALDNLGDYRLLPGIYFWTAMLAIGVGMFLMFVGIEERRNTPPEG
jgi:hypothetical protein